MELTLAHKLPASTSCGLVDRFLFEFVLFTYTTLALQADAVVLLGSKSKHVLKPHDFRARLISYSS